MPGIKRNLVYNFILTISQVVFPIISIPYISRVLDPSGLGKVSFIDSFAYYFVVIAEAGIITYGIREVARRRNDPLALKEIVSELISLHIRTSLLSVVLFSVLIGLVYDRISDMRLVWISLSFLITNAFSCEWYYWGKERFGYIALRSVLIRLLGLASLFFIVNGPADYYLYYTIIVGAAIMTIVWNISILIKEVKPDLLSSGWKKHLSGVAIMYGISLCYSVMIMLDSVFLGIAVSAAAVSYYALAIKIVRMITSFITDPLLVLYPNMVSRLSNDDKEGYRRITSLTFRWMIIVTIPLGTGVYLLSDVFTDLYLGDLFFPVGDCLKLLAFYPLIKSIGLFLNKQVLMPQNAERLVLRSLFVTMMIFIPLVLILSYYFSFRGTCIAIMIAEVVTSALNVFYARKIEGSLKLFSGKDILHSVVGSLLFIPVMILLGGMIMDKLILALAMSMISIAIYFLWMMVIKNNSMWALVSEIRLARFKNHARNG